MKKIVHFISRLTGSYVAAINFAANIMGAWPAIALGFLMVEGLLPYKDPDRITTLLIFICAWAMVVILLSVVAYGGANKLGLPAWWRFLRDINTIIRDGRVITSEEFFGAYPHNIRYWKDKEKYPAAPRTDAEKERIYGRALERGLEAVSRFPRNHTINAAWAALVVVLPFYFFEAWLAEGFSSSSVLVPILTIGWLVFVAFIFISCEIMTAGLRAQLKEILAVKRNEHLFSLRVKFGLQIMIIILSLCALFMMMMEPNLPLNRSIIFIVYLSLVSIYLTSLYIRSILMALRNIAGAVKDLGEGGAGNLYLTSLDREFVELGNDFSRAAREVVDYRHNLEERVREKTADLAAANADLTEKDNIIQMELDLARDIQGGLLPAVGNWRQLTFASYYRPMEKVSGDFYDIQEVTGERLGVLMADVSGHGVPAALITTMGKVSFVSNLQRSESPAWVLARMNKDLQEHVKTQDYMTAFLMVFEKNYQFRYTNAAHQKAIVFRENDEWEELDTHGFFLGTELDIGEDSYEEATSTLNEGEAILLFTDGITEMKNTAGEEYGKLHMAEFFQKNLGRDPEEVVEDFFRQFYEFGKDAPITDDISLLFVYRDGKVADEAGDEGSSELSHKKASVRQELLRAKGFFNRGEFTDGFAILEKLNSSYPGDPQILFPLARRKYLNGQSDEARDLLGQLSLPLSEIRNQQLREKIRHLQNELGL